MIIEKEEEEEAAFLGFIYLASAWQILESSLGPDKGH